MVEHQRQWPVSILCEVLDGGRSGYDDYVARQQTTGLEADELRLRARVRAMHTETGQSYGSRRLAQQLQDEGVAVGRAKARRLLKQAGVEVKRRLRRRPQTTDSRHG